MQEVTSEKAEILKFSNDEILKKQSSLKALRDDIEKGRKTQDMTFKALKK